MSSKSLKILIFGGGGMVGRGLLRECLLEPDVTVVKAVGRTEIPVQSPKLQQLVVKDLMALETFANELTGFDACFFSLGASAVGLSESEYEKINYAIPVAVGTLLAKLNEKMVFIYFSGAGTDSTEKGSTMWARVKGKTENALLRLPFHGAYMIRLAALIGKNGEVPKAWYRFLYPVMRPLLPVLERAFPQYVTDTESLGRAMLHLARMGTEKRLVENREIKLLATADS